jgi:hypothetical protein
VIKREIDIGTCASNNGSSVKYADLLILLFELLLKVKQGFIIDRTFKCFKPELKTV